MAVALETFVKQLTDSGIITPGKLENFIPPKAQPKDAQALAQQLVKSKQLTVFQAQEIYQGRGKSLILGNYTILDKLGAGGMGQVFKAQHRRMDRTVAIKMLPRAMMKDVEAAARFEREVRAAAKLSHPNIVAAYDADEAGGVHFLVLEYVAGKDLSALVKKDGPLPVAKAVNCVLQAARGLEFAHKNGVIHRDIKPANLLLDNSGNVKILDMGLARLDTPGGNAATEAELTGTGAVMGTVDYMAPEQALNSKRADARSDIYSLGCTLYYLLAGKGTYQGDSLMEKLLAHREQPIPSLQAVQADVPEQVEAVFRTMVAKKPEDRYQTVTDVVAALESCGADQPTSLSLRTSQSLPGASQSLPGAIDANSASDAMTFLRDAPPHAAQKPKPKKKATPAKRGGKNNRLMFGAVGAALLGTGLVAGVILMTRRHDGPLAVKPDAPDGVVQALNEQGKVQTPSPRLNDPALRKWTRDVAALPAEQQLPAVSKKLRELNPEFEGMLTDADGNGTPKIEKGIVTELGFRTDHVTDISPVQALAGLKRLKCFGITYSKPTKFSDLIPLQGMKLTSLDCSSTGVSDLSPLRGMPLTNLSLSDTQAKDLSPLQGMPLTILNCFSTPITDLSPLKSLATLTTLDLRRTKVTEDGVAALHAAVPNCKIEWPHQGEIYGQPAKSNDVVRTFSDPAAQQWMKDVATLPAEQQVNAVAKKLQQLNPEFDGKLAHQIQNGAVIELTVVPDHVTDISPLRALAGLKGLTCDGSGPGKGKLSDLSPLQGMLLNRLSCGDTPVNNLSPLRGMPLTQLFCVNTPVVDLSPLQGMRLTTLYCNKSQVSDLSPLRGMPLTVLLIGHTQVTDLSPLAGMKLTLLDCGSTKVSDLSPLRGMPLATLRIGSLPVSDLSQFKGMPLTELSCGGTKVTDLSPLHGMRLTMLDCGTTQVADLSPLSGMPLATLWCGRTQVADLSPLKGMNLTDVACDATKVSDLSPLEECRGLKRLNVNKTGVTAQGVAALQKALPNCKIEWEGTGTESMPLPVPVATKPVPVQSSANKPGPATTNSVPLSGTVDARLTRPTLVARQAALDKLKAMHHDQWAEATDHAHRAKLIKEFLRLSSTALGADERFACFEAAMQLATEDGDLSKALDVIAQWSAVFDVDQQAIAIKAIDDVVNGAKTPGQRKDLAVALLPVMDEQMAADNYDVVDLVLKAGLTLATKTREPTISKEYKLRETEMKEWLKLWSAARDARAKLADTPGDAAAHLALGRYLCLARGNWPEGLEHLRESSDEPLKAAAKAELAKPINADEQAEIGEAWWSIGEKEKEKGSVFPKIIWQEHGMQWIRKSLPKLPAAARNKLRPRTSLLAQQRKSAGTIFSLRRPVDVVATFGGHWYKFYHVSTSWPEAKRRCEAMGGHLAIVENSEENQFLKSLIVPETREEKDFTTWIGATDEEEDGKFVWVDGSPVTFFDWGSGQGTVAAEPYLSFWNSGPSSINMQWGDAPTYQRGYILCEWDQ